MFQPERNYGKYQSPIRRTRLDLCLVLLRALRHGVSRPTRLMYAVNMSWSPFIKLLKSMVSAEFVLEVDCDEDKRSFKHYEITRKGLNTLIYVDGDQDFQTLMEITQLI